MTERERINLLMAIVDYGRTQWESGAQFGQAFPAADTAGALKVNRQKADQADELFKQLQEALEEL